jgi:hypothetical protein
MQYRISQNRDKMNEQALLEQRGQRVVQIARLREAPELLDEARRTRAGTEKVRQYTEAAIAPLPKTHRVLWSKGHLATSLRDPTGYLGSIAGLYALAHSRR